MTSDYWTLRHSLLHSPPSPASLSAGIPQACCTAACRSDRQIHPPLSLTRRTPRPPRPASPSPASAPPHYSPPPTPSAAVPHYPAPPRRSLRRRESRAAPPRLPAVPGADG